MDQANGQSELNDDFWAELLIEDFGDKAGQSELDGRPEDVEDLAQQLGYLSSSSPK
jgi:heat shock transcription factor